MGLILLRHTQPEVAPGTCYGRTDLPPGPDFAKEAAAAIAALPRVTRLFSSPLRRCRALADAVAQARGLPVEIDARLIEIDFGRWEGVAWDAIPRHEIDVWAGDFWHACPHGGESVAIFAERVAGFLAEDRGPDPVLAVTHAGIMRAALYHAGEEGAWQRKFPFGGFIAL